MSEKPDIVIQLEKDLKEALKIKDSLKADVIKSIKTALQYYQIDAKEEMTNQDVMKILKKQAKQRKESIAMYLEANREELADTEEKEFDIITAYMPDAMSLEEVETLIDKIIKETGANNLQDFGKVMREFVIESKGNSDGATAAEVIKSRLSDADNS